MNRRAAAILALSAVVQVALATLPDTMGDLLDYRNWTRALTREGLAAAYWRPPMDSARLEAAVDYPPLFPYVLWTLGRTMAAISPAALDHDRLLDFLIRLPLVGANLLLAFLVYRETLRTAPALALPGLALMALNPALLFDAAYWGQADSPCVLLAVGATLALVRGRPEWAWAAITAAVLVKPLAAPLAPLVAVETVRRFGWGRLPRSALAALAVTVAAFLPFLAIDRLEDGLSTVWGRVEAMPYASVNAHNLWWLLCRGVPWTEASLRPLGLVTLKTVGLALFGAALVWTLVRRWCASQAEATYVAAATLALAFFVLSTHLHENHLLMALPFLALAAPRVAGARALLLAASFASLANMLLHDPYLAHVFRPLVPGPHLRLPQQLGLHPDLARHLVSEGYPWVVEEMRGETSLLGLLATLLNAQVHVAILAAWVLRVRGGFDLDALARGRWPTVRGAAGVGLGIFLLATGVPFLRHALSYGPEHAVLLRFGEASVRADGVDHVGIRSWEIEGRRRTVLYVHPPAEVRYRLVPPAGALLRFGVALDPAAWSPLRGDGVRFEVRVETGGRSRTVFSREIDPKNDPADRRWHDAVVDLSEEGGKDVTLVFATAGGARSNLAYDWAGFSDPTLRGR